MGSVVDVIILFRSKRAMHLFIRSGLPNQLLVLGMGDSDTTYMYLHEHKLYPGEWYLSGNAEKQNGSFNGTVS